MSVVGVVNVSEFALDLKRFGELAAKEAVIAQRKVTLEILRGVILANPVDTGRMRAAWTATVGAPATGEAGGEDLAGLTLGQSSWVVNNCSYSGFVNNFHPNSAGFVQAVIANVGAQIDVGVA